jgi:hypothetical protein
MVHAARRFAGAHRALVALALALVGLVLTGTLDVSAQRVGGPGGGGGSGKSLGILSSVVVPFFPTVSAATSTGVFKSPGLRNAEFTGPYFHTGGAASLTQVVDFYVRQGDFPNADVD